MRAGAGREQAVPVGRTEPSAAARALPAGLTDVALASFSSFVVGISAAQTLDTATLGVWGLLFGAYLLAAVLPTEFLLVPLEAALVSRPGPEQLRALPRTLGWALPVALPAAVLSMSVAAALAHGPPRDAVGRAAAIGVVLGTVSPLQDHLRRVLHQAGRSGTAALVSAVQAVVVVVVTVALRRTGADGLTAPVTALAAANVVSLGVGVAVALTRPRPDRPGPPLDLPAAVRTGGWLLGAGVTDRATQFACLGLLAAWVGTTGVGHYEAARVAAQPVLVLGLGVLSVYRRPLMRGAREQHRAGAVRARRAYVGLVAAGAAGYGAVAAVPWAFNPLVGLTPGAFADPGFLAAVIAATAVAAIAMAPTTELVGSGRASVYATRVTALGVVLVASCTTFLALGAGVYAWPLAFGVRGLLLWWTLRGAAEQIYRHPGQPPDDRRDRTRSRGRPVGRTLRP